jgi:hypothetical protein
MQISYIYFISPSFWEGFTCGWSIIRLMLLSTKRQGLIGSILTLEKARRTNQACLQVVALITEQSMFSD